MIITKPQTDPTLEWFLSHCHTHKYPAKSMLIHAGEKADTLYFIVKGSVAVVIKDEDADSEFFIHADSLNYEHGHDQRE